MRHVRALVLWDDALMLCEWRGDSWRLLECEVPDGVTPYDAMCDMLAKRAGIRVLEHYGDITTTGTWWVTRWHTVHPPPLGIDWPLVDDVSDKDAVEALKQWQLYRQEV